MKWLVIILGIIIILNYILILCIKEYKDFKVESFLCKKCLKRNKYRTTKCMRCNESLKDWKGYRSLFLGVQYCVDLKENYIRLSKVKFFNRLDVVILWTISILVSIIAGISVSKLITFI